MRPAEIYQELNGSVRLSTIYHKIEAARDDGVPIQKFRGNRRALQPRQPFRVTLPDALYAPLTQAAAARSLTLGDLTARLIRAVIKDDLFAAVLDERH